MSGKNRDIARWKQLGVYDADELPAIELVPILLADQLLKAAARCGYDGEGTGGLQGWLQRLAQEEPRTFAQLIKQLLPTHLSMAVDAQHSGEFVLRWED